MADYNVEVIWDDAEKTIIRQIFKGTTTLEDYFYATDEVTRLATSVNHRVYSIHDRIGVVHQPKVLMPAIRYANDNIPPNIDLRIIVRPVLVTRIVVDMARQIAPNLMDNIRYTNSLDEAYELIADRQRQLANPRSSLSDT